MDVNVICYVLNLEGHQAQKFSKFEKKWVKPGKNGAMQNPTI